MYNLKQFKTIGKKSYVTSLKNLKDFQSFSALNMVVHLISVRNEQSSGTLHSVGKTWLGYQVIIQLQVLQNTVWHQVTLYGSGWVLGWRKNFSALKKFPWCVTEDACTALHKTTTVAPSDLFTFFPSFQVIYTWRFSLHMYLLSARIL